MSHESKSPPSRRQAFGAGLFLLAAAAVGLDGLPASAENRPAGRTGNGNRNGPSRETIPPGTPSACPPTMVCNATPRSLRADPPPFQRRQQVPLPRERCGVVSPDGRLDQRCRNSN